MSFKITDGIEESKLAGWLENATKQWGTFDDGRVNYTKADKAPIVMCTITCGGEILLVKRGHGLADANGYWSTVNGFIDEAKPVWKQAQQEVKEELGFEVKESQITVAQSYTLTNLKEKRSYIVFACRVDLSTKPDIVLNEEHTDFAWINRSAVNDHHILDDLPEAIDRALAA